MPNTYRARLRGNVLEWVAERPALPEAGDAVEVDVIVVGEGLPALNGGHGRRMAAALERLAALQGRSLPGDAAAWEREIRADRKLPGRDARSG